MVKVHLHPKIIERQDNVQVRKTIPHQEGNNYM